MIVWLSSSTVAKLCNLKRWNRHFRPDVASIHSDTSSANSLTSLAKSLAASLIWSASIRVFSVSRPIAEMQSTGAYTSCAARAILSDISLVARDWLPISPATLFCPGIDLVDVSVRFSITHAARSLAPRKPLTKLLILSVARVV